RANGGERFHVVARAERERPDVAAVAMQLENLFSRQLSMWRLILRGSRSLLRLGRSLTRFAEDCPAVVQQRLQFSHDELGSGRMRDSHRKRMQGPPNVRRAARGAFFGGL